MPTLENHREPTAQVAIAAGEFAGICAQLKTNSPGPHSIAHVLGLSALEFDPNSLAQGSYDTWLYRQDCPVGIRDIEIKQDFTVCNSIQNQLSLEFILNGGSDLELGRQSLINNEMPRAYLSSHGSNGQQTRFHKAGDRIRGLGLWLSPQMLIEDFGLDPSLLPANVKSMIFLEQDSTATLPLTAKVKNILNEILQMPFSGLLADQFLKAKITELLCHTVQSLMAPEQEFCNSNQLSQHKSHAIGKVLKTLEANIARPPSLAELAEQVGMSRSTLASTFKASYGMSLSKYLAQRKMETAQGLLQEGKLPVLEVALSVGYHNQSGFGRAYKRHFGHPPKDDRPK